MHVLFVGSPLSKISCLPNIFANIGRGWCEKYDTSVDAGWKSSIRSVSIRMISCCHFISLFPFTEKRFTRSGFYIAVIMTFVIVYYVSGWPRWYTYTVIQLRVQPYSLIFGVNVSYKSSE